MTVDTLSLLILAASVAASLAALAVLKPQRHVRIGAMAGGVTATSIDIVGVVVADRLDWWHLDGALRWGGVPLSLNVAWAFLGAAFYAGYDRAVRGRIGGGTALGVVALTAVVGVAADSLGRAAGILTLGQNMHIVYTAPYWAVCTGLGLSMHIVARRWAQPRGTK